MKILIFGVSCVGNPTIGTLLAKKLNCRFIDLDNVNIKNYGSIEKFQRMFPFSYDRVLKQAMTLRTLIDKDKEDVVIAVTPINYADGINELFELENVIAFEVQDTAECIFDRLLFTDENDVIIENNEEYKLEHASYYLNEIKEDMVYYGNVYEEVENKIFLDCKSAEEGASMIYDCIMELNKKLADKGS